MNIGIDIDEVLAETVNELIPLYNKETNKHITRDDITEYKFHEIWHILQEQAENIILKSLNTTLWTSIEPVKDAIQIVHELAKHHTLVIMTARPQSMKEVTLKWINKHFTCKFKDIIFTSEFLDSEKNSGKKKAQACLDNNLDFYIEDDKAYAKQCAQNTNVLLLDKPWNKNMPPTQNITRVGSWKEIVSLINDAS